jgi:hypothetical protein
VAEAPSEPPQPIRFFSLEPHRLEYQSGKEVSESIMLPGNGFFSKSQHALLAFL